MKYQLLPRFIIHLHRSGAGTRQEVLLAAETSRLGILFQYQRFPQARRENQLLRLQARSSIHRKAHQLIRSDWAKDLLHRLRLMQMRLP